MCSAKGRNIAKPNIHMHAIKVPIFRVIDGRTPSSLGDGSVSTQRHWKLASRNKVAIPCESKKMFVDFETMAACNTVELLWRPVGLAVGAIGSITRTDCWKGGARMVDMLKDFVPRKQCSGRVRSGGRSDGRLIGWGRINLHGQSHMLVR